MFGTFFSPLDRNKNKIQLKLQLNQKVVRA